MNKGTFETPFGIANYEVLSASRVWIRFTQNDDACRVNGVPFHGDVTAQINANGVWGLDYSCCWIRRNHATGGNYSTDLSRKAWGKVYEWATKTLPGLCTVNAIHGATVDTTRRVIERKKTEIAELEAKLAAAKSELAKAEKELAALA